MKEKMIISMIILALILPVILITANTLIYKKNILLREKLSPFECGFDPKSSARLPFSMRFFLIAVIFLIFDIELTIIMPIPLIMTMKSLITWMSISMFFIMILLLGLYHEWSQGALNWAK